MNQRMRRSIRSTCSPRRLCTLVDMRAWEPALVEARVELAREPHDAHVHAHMAQALHAQGRYEEGLRAADAAIRLEPNNEWHHRIRTFLLMYLDRDEEALRRAEDAVRLAPESTTTLHNLASCQFNCLRYADMLETVRRYERLAPEIEAVHHLRGEALWGLGDIDGARAALEKALSIDPSCFGLYADLGSIVLSEGRTEAAIERFVDSLRLQPHRAGIEARLVYAARRHLDADRRTAGGRPAQALEAGSASVVGTQLHVLSFLVPEAYRRLFRAHPPAVEYASPFSEAEAAESQDALRAWRLGGDGDHLRTLAAAGLPTELTRSLAEGRTAYHPAGLGLDDLLRHWMAAVLDFQRGYPRDIEDYGHDCGVRRAIGHIAEHVSLPLRQKIRATLEPWDNLHRAQAIRPE